jgi:hypothetical protein
MRYLLSAVSVALALGIGGHVPAGAQQPPAGPQYTAAGELIRPSDFREWMFVTAGLGMTYSEQAPRSGSGQAPRSGSGQAPRPGSGQAGSARAPNFTNVYVTPASYRAFMKTGQWPDKTMFILEIRASSSQGSINKGGHFQSDLLVIEASVKDEARYPGKWAFFDFGRDMKPQAAPLPSTARCYACHAEHGAVDNTFVQFYPTLREAASRLGVLKAAPASVAHH